MSVSEDAVSFRSYTSNTSSTTHTPGGTPTGVLVAIAQQGSGADSVTSVTYGGVALSRVRSERDTGDVGDLGRTYLYFKGSGIPSGAQTLLISLGSSREQAAWCVTFLADDPEVSVVAHNGRSDSVDDPGVTLATPTDYEGFVYAILFSGGNLLAQTTAGSGYTLRDGSVAGGHQFSAASHAVLESGAKSGASVVANFATTVADDVALSAVAFESPPVTSASMARVGGVFAFTPILSRASGVFAVRPATAKQGGVFG